jgi:hypothetical protein
MTIIVFILVDLCCIKTENIRISCRGPNLVYNMNMRSKSNHKKVSIQTFKRDADNHLPNIVTIWVHGTGRNPLLRKLHLSPQGITSLAELPQGWGLKRMGVALCEHDSLEFAHSHFYAFGWSGKLSFKSRELAGRDFDAALRQIEKLHEHQFGEKPRFRVIAHSHGCNVVLNAAEHLLATDSPLVIDELVFLACPVQHATEHKIASPAFISIFSLYSPRDMIQVLDPQGLNFEKVASGGKIFSGRRFVPQKNLVQAQITWKGNQLTHAGFIRERFGKALPSILAELRQSKHEIQAPDDDCIVTII